jgi:hypothetical protein
MAAAVRNVIFDPPTPLQVDFGAGPYLSDPAHQALRRTWAFVMTRERIINGLPWRACAET